MMVFVISPIVRPKVESKPKSSAFFARIILFLVSNMLFTMCICVLHIYNMSFLRHIYSSNIISYDIRVAEKFGVCTYRQTGLNKYLS